MLFTLGRLAYAAFQGTDELVGALGRFGVKFALESHRANVDAGDEMVQRMRADAPDVTGHLVSGITVEHPDDETTVVRASALKTAGGTTWDYAPFVEAGHGAAALEPFFYQDADAVLEEFRTNLDDAIAAAADSEGF